MIQSIIASVLLSVSVVKPVKASAISYNDYANVYGSYNLRNTFAFECDDFSDTDYTIIFDDFSETKHYLNPFNTSNDYFHYYYLSEIDVHIEKSYNYCAINFVYYDVYSDSNFYFNVAEGSNVSMVDSVYNQLIFMVRQSYVLHDELAKLFNVFFTRDDNIFTTTYNGYYSIANNTSSISDDFFIFGACSFNNYVYSYITNCSDGVTGGSQTTFVCNYYNISLNEYTFGVYSLPLNKDEVNTNYFLINNGKIRLADYDVLSHYGVFSYVPDTTYVDADFQDLLFSVMDSPIYMISRILNFELFGFNLFFALTGFLTIIILIFLIRKFL